jgi:hypothetical protein
MPKAPFGHCEGCLEPFREGEAFAMDPEHPGTWWHLVCWDQEAADADD